MTTRSQLEHLFISKVRIKALRYFLQNPDKPIHLRGAVRELNEEINAVRRELSRMEKIGFVIAEKKGNRKYFHLSNEFAFNDELLGLVYKSFGLGAELINAKKSLGDVHFALLTQGYTRSQSVGKHKVDLVVIGEDMRLEQLKHLVEEAEKRIKRDIFYAVLTPEDFETRKRRRDLFVQEVLQQDFMMLIGDKAEFYAGVAH